jgi:hypothetical protein
MHNKTIKETIMEGSNYADSKMEFHLTVFAGYSNGF